MTECEFHKAMDARSGSLGIRTLRCAHVGDVYIHERLWPEAGSRWLNRSTLHRGPKPELESATTAADADRIWAEMERRMVEGAAFGEPY
jgi:hypothetical protein